MMIRFVEDSVAQKTRHQDRICPPPLSHGCNASLGQGSPIFGPSSVESPASIGGGRACGRRASRALR